MAYNFNFGTGIPVTTPKPDAYSLAEVGVPMESMLTWNTPQLNVPQMAGSSIPGFDTQVLASPEMSPALMNMAAPSLWNQFTGFMKNSGIAGSTDPVTGAKTDGWGAPAVGLLQALNAFSMGNRQLKISKGMLDDSRNQFAMNYGAQRQALNTRMEDRQRARVAANPKAESVESYMARNRIN